MQIVVIGSPSCEHVKIQVIGYESPQASDIYDGNWLISNISVKVGAWSGLFDAALRTEEFQNFLQQLKDLYRNLEGIAKFETMEGQLILNFTGNPQGQIMVEGVGMDQPGIGNEFHFHFSIDQSYLPSILSSLEAVLSDFPVRG